MNRIAPLVLGILAALPASADPATYATPQEALDALVGALQVRDRLLVTFGPESRDLIISDDEDENTANRNTILALYGEGFRFAPAEGGGVELLLGAEGWPFPIPLAQSGDGWAFDTVAGREDAGPRDRPQRARDPRPDRRLWRCPDPVPPDRPGRRRRQGVRRLDHLHPGDARRAVPARPDSPLGSELARASADGYSDGNTDHEPEPFLGYYFRLLNAQGPAAPGGEMSYIVGGNQVVGHALIAWPADYGVSGIPTFIVSENGIILQTDLGEDTPAVADAITAYNPDASWSPVD